MFIIKALRIFAKEMSLCVLQFMHELKLLWIAKPLWDEKNNDFGRYTFGIVPK